MKRCSTLIAIRDMQIETTMRYYHTSARMVIIKKKITNVGKDVKKGDLVNTVCVHIHRYRHYEKHL